MEEVFVKKFDLDNGYRVDIIDASKKVGLDASHVKLILRMNVPVEESLFKDDKYKEINFKEIKDKLGDNLVFEIIKERNLINIDKKEEVFSSLMDNFVKTSLVYLSKDDFPPKFVLKKFKDKKF